MEESTASASSTVCLSVLSRRRLIMSVGRGSIHCNTWRACQPTWQSPGHSADFEFLIGLHDVHGARQHPLQSSHVHVSPCGSSHITQQDTYSRQGSLYLWGSAASTAQCITCQ